jgi:hypothetical protein
MLARLRDVVGARHYSDNECPPHDSHCSRLLASFAVAIKTHRWYVSSTLTPLLAGIIATWIGFACISLGLGLGVRTLLGYRTNDDDAWIACFWVGWCSLVAALQVWHLLHRVDWHCLILFVVVAAAGAWLGRRELASLRKPTLHAVATLLVLLCAAVWVANQSLNAPGNYDSGLYHLQAIKWDAACSIVPGLGNLHYRLAYNNASFLYAALVDAAPLHEAAHLSSGLLVLAMFAQLAFAFSRVVRRAPLDVGHLATIALAPAVFVQLLEPNVWIEGPSAGWNPFSPSNISSPTPDLVIYALGVAITPPVARLIFRETTDDTRSAALFIVAVIASVGTAVKLSFATFGLLSLVVCLLLVRPSRRELTIVGAVGAIAIVPWIIRGLILSGYFLYPAYSLGHINVGWLVPEGIPHHDYRSMKGWARSPSGDWMNTLDNWRWVSGWYDREFAFWRRLGVPLTLTACAALLRLAVGPWTRKTWTEWLVLAPPAGMIAFWFVTAPVSRYLGSTCWCLAAGAVLLAVAQLDRRSAAIAVSLLALLLGSESVRIAKWSALTDFAPIPSNPGRQMTLASGLVVYEVQGGSGAQMWNAPLMATPTLRTPLRHRGPTVCDGFTEIPPK